MKRNTGFYLITAAAIVAGVATATAQSAADLGKSLTPLGAEKAGNAAGTIPAWEGGITQPPSGYKSGDHHPDPFADDKPSATINAANAEQYADNLTEGHKALLARYASTYKMPVYPTRRSASAPQDIYDATKANVASAKLVDGGNGVSGASRGAPFPLPKTGQEVIWNHLLRYRGLGGLRTVGQVAPTRSGNYTLVQLEEKFLWNYHQLGAATESVGNVLAYFEQKVTAPARLAGTILMVHETLDQVKESRRAWVYNTGQRRVRRAPQVAYDNPGTASDGMRTSDQLDMFNGGIDRYDWKLVGKREVYVPYNSYKLHSDSLKVADIVTPLHINQEHSRYELHRVWVVEATLKEGKRHIYAKRRFYVDEDSWAVLVVDQYDNRDRLWRVSEGHSINYYDILSFWSTLEVHMDLLSGRYLAHGLDNENEMYDFSYQSKSSDYTPAALRRRGRR
ncbi:MAG: DUF1329 domain-containing protein [Verrucomicrobiota bacterium]|jgi:hypothetical protein|nr:DUF1329 domain-containing protein [Verrucomicrobiota bacterium]MDP6752339.1 DUF1329 domain-containing protein [Verrucomicrobiota bacterium]